VVVDARCAVPDTGDEGGLTLLWWYYCRNLYGCGQSISNSRSRRMPSQSRRPNNAYSTWQTRPVVTFRYYSRGMAASLTDDRYW
jgi:hypothetical protein